MNNLIINEDASHALILGKGYAGTVSFSSASKSGTQAYPAKARPTQTEPKASGGDISPWGDDNLFPQTVLEEARKSTIVGPVLEWKARALYSGGLVYGEVNGYDEQGNEQFTRIKDDKVEAFFRRSNIRRYLIESITDFYYFYNAFPEMIPSNDRSEIVALTALPAEDCRYKKRSGKGVLEKVFASGQWTGTSLPDDATEINVLDVYYDPVSRAKETNWSKFIYPLSYPTPGCSYYQLAPWNAIRQSGWGDLAAAIPEFKKALLENQATIKYHVEVHEMYWKWKYTEWDSIKGPDRRKIIADECKNFESIMAGMANAGKTLMTTTFTNRDGKEIIGWKITAVDNKIKDGMYIEDSQEASSHLLFALGVHPTLVGSGPGKGMGAGSGSDQRVAFNNYISTCEPHRDIILEPFYFIRDFNGWNPNIEFRFKLPMIMTMDKGKQVQQEAS